MCYALKVYQYQCGSEAGGPPDCLQYFTSTTGTIANFGFDTSQTDVAASSRFNYITNYSRALNKYFADVSQLFP